MGPIEAEVVSPLRHSYVGMGCLPGNKACCYSQCYSYLEGQDGAIEGRGGAGGVRGAVRGGEEGASCVGWEVQAHRAGRRSVGL